MSVMCISSHLCSLSQPRSGWSDIHPPWPGRGVFIFSNCWGSSVVRSHQLQRWGQPRHVFSRSPVPLGCSRCPSMSRSTEGTSCRSPAPAAVGSSGFLRVVMTSLFRQARVQPMAGTGVRQQCWGVGVSQSWRANTRQGLGRIPDSCLEDLLSVVPASCPPPRWSPLAEAAAWSPRKRVTFRGFTNSSHPGVFLDFALCLAYSPCLLCQMAKRKAYFSRGMLLFGW